MNTISYPSTEQTAKKLAERIAQEVKKADHYTLALAGTKTAIPLFKALVEADIDWQKIDVFYADEIMEGPQKGIQNLFAQAHLWDKVNIPEAQIHQIDTNAPLENELQRYMQEISRIVPKVAGVPRFDMVLLEMTSDGHAAGIFAGQHDIFLEEETLLSNKNPKDNTQHLTLSLHTIEAAKNICLYAFGGEARFSIGDIVNLLPEAKEYPTNFIAFRCPWIYLYADGESMREKSYSIY